MAEDGVTDGGGGGSLITPDTTNAGSSDAAPPASSGAFDFRSTIGDDGRFVADWTSKLPEELKAHSAHFSKYGDPIQALQHTLSLSQLLGKKSDALVIPGADATREEWAPVLKRLGVPETPEGYGLKVPETLPPGVTVDAAELGEFSKFAHDLGLTPQQAAKLQEYDLGRSGKQYASATAASEAAQAASFKEQSDTLTKAWGTGNDRIQKMALAERAALTFGFTPEEITGSGADPLFANAKFVMTLARAGAAMSEDTLVKGTEVNSQGGMQAKAMDVISNPQNPMYKKYWAGDADTGAQVISWMNNGRKKV
jgi:hypothetical protein